MTNAPLDGAYYANGQFVFQRAHVRTESGQQTVISEGRTVCEVHRGHHNPRQTAQEIASAMNAQFRVGG